MIINHVFIQWLPSLTLLLSIGLVPPPTCPLKLRSWGTIMLFCVPKCSRLVIRRLTAGHFVIIVQNKTSEQVQGKRSQLTNEKASVSHLRTEFFFSMCFGVWAQRELMLLHYYVDICDCHLRPGLLMAQQLQESTLNVFQIKTKNG